VAASDGAGGIPSGGRAVDTVVGRCSRTQPTAEVRRFVITSLPVYEALGVWPWERGCATACCREVPP
jgi:hypothetical protein